MESEQLLQEQPQVIEQSLPTEPTMDNNNYEYQPPQQPPQQPEFNENINNNVVQQPYVNVNVESVENNVINPENVVIPDNMINMNMDIMDTIDNLDNLDNIPNPEIRIPAIDDLQPQPQPQQEIQNIQQNIQQEPLPMQQEEKTQQMQVIQEEIQPQMSENIIIPQQEPQYAPQNVPQQQEEFAPNLPPDIPEDSPQQQEQTNVQQEAQEPPQQQETHVHENQRMMVDYDNRYQQQQILQQPSQSHVQAQVQVQVDDNKMMVDDQQEQEQIMVQPQAPQHVQEDIKPQLPEPMETDDIEPPIEPPPPPPQQQQHIPQRITPTNNNSNNQNRNQSQNNMIPELVQCKNLLIEFMKRPETEPFNEPVDWKGLNLPDYPLTITKPMDLGSILNKLAVNKYKTADQFASDVRLVFRNAKHYNQVASGIYVVAENLLKQFERRFARIRKNNGNKKRKYSDKMNNNGQESSYKQRKEFTTLIQSLTPNELGGIVELIDKKSPMALNDIAGGKDELEIEVYHIDGQTLTDLIVHIEKTIAKRGKKKKKTYGY